MYKFTFHYASTLSMMDFGFYNMDCNLHSTMLLLYLRKEETTWY